MKDRDENTDEKRQEFLDCDNIRRMLNRREIENYLFDKEVLKRFCTQKSTNFDEDRYNRKVGDVIHQDLKLIQQEIQACCEVTGDISAFKRDLAKSIVKDMQVYNDLVSVIF